MIKDCIVKEYVLYDREVNTVANEMKSFLNDGYRVDLKYSADTVGRVLLIAVKEEEEPKKKTTKKKDIE